MQIPPHAQFVLRRLADSGYAAYVVGGCVRDSLLGRAPGDWDVCSNALPEEAEACFPDCRVIETGLKHGTVTVLAEGVPVEITTFRRDGPYRDHRRPDQVAFVDSLEEDLARRDFTINAMAAGLDSTVIDPFGGRADLDRKVIRCVGDPDLRFHEDALRILRGLRFSSQLEFTIDPATARAMERNKALLPAVSGERIFKELTGLLIGPGAAAVLEQYGTVLTAVLPEIVPAMGFAQRSPYHDRDVWGHTVQAVGYSEPEKLTRWALLLHDLGKPDTFTVDENGIGHFYGHQARGEALARSILTRLHVDRETLANVCQLVRYHDAFAPAERRIVKRWLSRYGEAQFFRLMEVMRADTLAHVETAGSRRRYAGIMEFTALAREILQETPCLQIRDLAVGGRDVMALGVPSGPRVGELLRMLLEQVLDERCPNERQALLSCLKSYLEEEHAD